MAEPPWRVLLQHHGEIITAVSFADFCIFTSNSRDADPNLKVPVRKLKKNAVFSSKFSSYCANESMR